MMEPEKNKFLEGLEGCSKSAFQFGCGWTVMVILIILLFTFLGGC